LLIPKFLWQPGFGAIALACSLLVAACGSNSAGTDPSTTNKSKGSGLAISGSPATSVDAGQSYLFVPTASDSAGAALTFSITGKPSWASFSTTTGELSGTPATAQVGSYPNVVITVSAGGASTSLPAFSVKVIATQGATGSATLTWVAPTANTDGTPIDGLAGYHIYYGTSQSALTQVVDVPGPTTTTYAVPALAPGTYYFAVAAYNAAGFESAPSNIDSVSI
jgi:putative Ig domain-containing protein